jgi:hypothetical protein
MGGRFTVEMTWGEIVALYRLTLDRPPQGALFTGAAFIKPKNCYVSSFGLVTPNCLLASSSGVRGRPAGLQGSGKCVCFFRH